MKCIVLTVLVFMLSTSPLTAAEDTIKTGEVVVTAAKIEEPFEETTSSLRVIKEEEIHKMNVEFVPDVLRRIPDLNVTQNGGPGKSATVILRGGSARQVLVMIDGVKVKSTTLGEFDFSGITANDIERIEVVKGPQSTMYGSEAMAGVINIITKKGEGRPGITASFEGGSFGTYNPSVTVSGGSSNADYRITGSYFDTEGISAAKSGTEKDGYRNATVSGKFGIKTAEVLDLAFTGRYYYDRSELDAFAADDPNYVQHGNHYLISGKGKLYMSDIYEQVLTFSRVKDSIKYRDDDTSFNVADIVTAMNALEWQHNMYFSEAYTLALGAEYRDEKGENTDYTGSTVFDNSVDNKAFYLNNKLKVLNDDLIVNAGLRYDDHETFGHETTYRIGAIYNVRPAMLKIKGSYGTGFRAPTLNELFYNDPWGSSGNLNLKPEKSSSWEAGIEKEIIKDRASVSLTYFAQKYEDLIDWVETPPGSWLYSPQNLSEAEIRGIEAGVAVNLTDEFLITSSYSYTDTEDKDTGRRLKRRPLNKANLTADYSAGPLSVLASYTYVGKMFESVSRGNLSSYSLVNLSGSYKINKNVRAFARMENLLDEDYESAADYSTPGFSAYAGVELMI